jgi:hypothetical protein
MKRNYIAIDIGAGRGAKIALFSENHALLAETLLTVHEFGKVFPSFSDALIRKIEIFLKEEGISLRDIRAIGIACAGILNSDGSFKLVNNMPYFNSYNLKATLNGYFRIPVDIENDANAGGLAEWSVLRLELLYWVFGGGWGGVWISKDGNVMFPTLDWNGDDSVLHYTNEPGYSIPLDKITLRTLFNEVNASFERFEMVLLSDLMPKDGILRGPSGNPNTLRAETILSGPGRCRLFRAIVGDDDFYANFLDITESEQMSDPSVAGKHISKLSSMRVEAAINTDRLYGKILAFATRIMLKRAYEDGMPMGLPICLGGKPSYALPYFGPSAQRALGRMGLMNYLRPSVIDERGSNANLVGASVLAEKAYLRKN